MKVSIWIFSGRDESPDVALRTTRFVAGYLDFTSTTMWVIYNNRIRLNPLVYHHVPIKSILKCLHQGYLNLSKMFFTSKKTFWGTKAYQMPKSIPKPCKNRWKLLHPAPKYGTSPALQEPLGFPCSIGMVKRKRKTQSQPISQQATRRRWDKFLFLGIWWLQSGRTLIWELAFIPLNWR